MYHENGKYYMEETDSPEYLIELLLNHGHSAFIDEFVSLLEVEYYSDFKNKDTAIKDRQLMQITIAKRIKYLFELGEAEYQFETIDDSTDEGERLSAEISDKKYQLIDLLKAFDPKFNKIIAW